VGSIGWTPPNFFYNIARIRGTHGSDRNARLCAGCHVTSYDVTDPTTGAHVYTVTGHLFKAIPCLDPQGLPEVDDTCGMNTTERTFQTCTGTGCHGDEDIALTLMLDKQDDIADLVADVASLLSMVSPSEFSNADTVFTVAEGARFNQRLGEITSSAVHNPFMTEALLEASIDALVDTYMLAPPAPPRRTSSWRGHAVTQD
jgi:hypothetical protein